MNDDYIKSYILDLIRVLSCDRTGDPYGSMDPIQGGNT